MKKAFAAWMAIIFFSSCARVDWSFSSFKIPSLPSFSFTFPISDGWWNEGNEGLGDPQGQPKPITKSIIHDQEGVVEVIMKVSEDGQWKLVNLSATNEDLAKYVVSKLKEYQKQTPSKAIGQVVKYRFVFKQQT